MDASILHTGKERTKFFNATIFQKRKTTDVCEKSEKLDETGSKMNRIPKLEDLEKERVDVNLFRDQNTREVRNTNIEINQSSLGIKPTIRFGKSWPVKRPSHVLYKSFGHRSDKPRKSLKEYRFFNYCLFCVCLSFLLGLAIGVTLMGSTQKTFVHNEYERTLKNDAKSLTTRTLNSLKTDAQIGAEFLGSKKERKDKLNRFAAVSFTDGRGHRRLSQAQARKKYIYPKSLTDDMKEILKDNKMSDRKLDKHAIINLKTSNNDNHVPNDRTVLYENIFWGPEVENFMPQGYGPSSGDIWERYVNNSEVVKLETGCGRMQNRLVTFKDGIQACVRYRQNTDQIQGEIFSFYVAKLLNLTNVAPSVVKVVDLKDRLWQNVASDVAAAQWNTNRAVVLTQYIPSLESAKIPDVFKPANRHLNKNDILEISTKENVETDNSKKILIDKLKPKHVKSEKSNSIKIFDHIDMKLNKKTIDLFIELAQWSDLIIFDYLTANLDRIVNNLFNFQWNVNIMDGPAHNLAKKMDSGLLLFLDNESGLLHGYRLLKKYNVYHSLMLDNLCVFRKTTADALRTLHKDSVGAKLSEMFHSKNNAVIRDILPPLPEKNAKILHERIGKVLSQIEKCQQMFSMR